MPAHPDAPLRRRAGATRRRILRGAAALTAAGMLAACSAGGGEPTTSASKTSGPFSYTDDRGKAINLPNLPQRIVAQASSAAVLWDFGLRPIGVFGPQKLANGENNPQAGDVDLSAVESVGVNWGEFNVEKYASLRPDLLVTNKYGEILWYVPEESQSKIEQVAPMAVVDLTGKSVPEAIESYAKLARALGADLDAPAVQQARAEFEQASEELRKAAQAKPGLKVLVVSSNKDNVYFAEPNEYGDLEYLRELGLDVVEPAGKEPFFEAVSWEQIDKYPADLILYDTREQEVTWPLAKVQTMPTWKELPAVKAGQVGAWRAETPFSYQQQTAVLRELTETINKARADVVP
ncbi:ABC transporter substrate-binding protein [Micromonospora deserti]|nr:ABC transporter substrate-binding protein [Micromonospora deserti]